MLEKLINSKKSTFTATIFTFVTIISVDSRPPISTDVNVTNLKI